ncbi:MAG TPA: hypothetical protein VI072_08400 [Polyangiaceae bacterium]
MSGMAKRIAFSFRRSCGTLLLAAALGATSLTLAPAALAQDVSGAASAYSRGQQADLTGDHATAAELYELANTLAPSQEALRSALRARRATGQLGIAAGHAEELLELYPDDEKSAEIAQATLEEAKEKLARYVIHCKPRSCNVVVDDAAVTTAPKIQHSVYLEPGKHQVKGAFGSNQTPAQEATAEAGGESTLSFDAPPEPKRPRSLAGGGEFDVTGDGGTAFRDRGLSPVFVISGAVVTVALAGVAVWSGMDTLSAKDDYNPERNSPEDFRAGEKSTKRAATSSSERTC